jgi:glycosyltransferase involved in cell wall biosynthesis
VVANSQGLRELALDFHPRADIDVIPNGVDLAAYRPKEEYAGPPALLFVGRVVYQKGLDMLLEALKDAGDGNWDLAIAGGGPEVEPLKRMSAAYGIGDRIHFLGWVGREELRDIYRRANIFVFPSRHEGMPNALLEAMASGLPAVASRIAGNEELVVHGETGYLFSLEERAGLRHHLQKLLVDAGLRRQLGEAARARVEKKYSWRRTAEGYLELARQLVR